MYAAKADPQHQRMQIIIHQALNADEFNQLIESIESEAVQLQPCWVAAVDMRGMWVDNPYINEQFEKIQTTLMACQAGKIGTLLDNASIRMHLIQAGNKTCSNVITRRFFDVGDWERFLTEA